MCVEILPIHHRSIRHTVYIQLLYSHDMAATKDPQTLSVNMVVSASYLYSAYQRLTFPVPRDGTREHAGLKKNNNEKKEKSKIGRVSLRFFFFSCLPQLRSFRPSSRARRDGEMIKPCPKVKKKKKERKRNEKLKAKRGEEKSFNEE